jgi:histidine triad (HIT) family protein
MAATCAFCAIIRGEEKAVIILETERLLAFLDHRPLFLGHTLLVPKQHLVLLSDLPADQVPEFFGTAQRLERAVEDGLGADGSMMLINNVVSQSVPHLHLHVIPRNKRDGLRFWLGPRKRYDTPAQAEAVAEKIRAALRHPEPGAYARALRWWKAPWHAGSQENRENRENPLCPTTFRDPTASRVTCSVRCLPGMTGWPRSCPSGRTDGGVRPWSTGCCRRPEMSPEMSRA